MVSALWHGFEMVLAHEREENIRYDVIVRVRPDSGLHQAKTSSSSIYVSTMTPLSWRLAAQLHRPRTIVSVPGTLTTSTKFQMTDSNQPCRTTGATSIDNCFWSHPADSAIDVVRTWYRNFHNLEQCLVHPELQLLAAAAAANVSVTYAIPSA